MPISNLGICFGPASGLSIGQLLPLAQKAEIAGFESIWTGEFGNDSLAWAQALAQATGRCRIGTSITNVYLRHPAVVAAAAAAIAELSESRLILGLGTSHRSLVERSLGLRLVRPLDHLQEYARVIRALLSGEQIEHEGDFFKIQDYRLQAPLPESTRVPIFVAALGLAAAKRAAQYADGLILTLTPADYVQELVSIVRDSAQSVGRDPDTIDIIQILPCFPARDDEAMERAACKMICRYTALPFYENMFVKAGFYNEVRAIRQALGAGQMQQAEQAVSVRMIEDLAVIGDPATYGPAIERYQRTGTRVVLYPNGLIANEPIAWQEAINVLLERATKVENS